MQDEAKLRGDGLAGAASRWVMLVWPARLHVPAQGCYGWSIRMATFMYAETCADWMTKDCLGENYASLHELHALVETRYSTTETRSSMAR
jgi:hypothetical protein